MIGYNHVQGSFSVGKKKKKSKENSFYSSDLTNLKPVFELLKTYL